MAAFAFQVDAGVALYKARDKNREAVKTPFHAFFYGRNLFENGLYAEAEQQFANAARDPGLDASFKNRASIWEATSRLKQGKSANWPSAGSAAAQADLYLAKWKTEGADGVTCSGGAKVDAAAARCFLLQFATAEQEGRLSKMYTAIAATDPSDASHPFGDLSFYYFDPAMAEALALADFRASLNAFEKLSSGQGQDQINLYAGIAAYELKLFDQAEVLLNATNMSERFVYLGAIALERGNKSEADNFWQQARAAGSSAIIEWAAVASRYDEMSQEIVQYLRPDLVNGISDRTMAQKTAGAFLNLGQNSRAFSLTEKHYRAELNNDLDRVSPIFLTRLAHGRFLNGRSYYNLVNSHLHVLVERLPTLIGVTEVIKASTSPNASSGESFTEN